jgi:Trk K+ transport system NAD-binding subunit
LLKRDKKVIIIEINEEAKHVDYFRSIGADVYIGDARSEKVLSDVNIKHSAAIDFCHQ